MTVAIYQETPNGKLRLGTFTPRKGQSIRAVSHAYMAKNPAMDPAKLFIAKRLWIEGKWVDDTAGLFPFDVS